ncbi:KUP/HAK/KT family potassium transporter [Streptococcus agalactiae]|uniref:KUP/HAK/KT family potassium transporter n=1 Tax=Streptococcus agalactiae TaxID=1311 RepID=UPI00030E6C84
MQHVNHSSFDKASKAGFIIALGIVYGDIGTSPLYTCNHWLKTKVVFLVLQNRLS